MTKCNKLSKRARIGAFLLLTTVMVTIWHEYVHEYTALFVIYVLSASVGAATLMGPYVKCLFDYNNSHKPPHSRKRL